MENGGRNYWFRSKYGFGWYPVNWKGAVTFFLYFASLFFVFVKISENSETIGNTLLEFAPFIFGATIILLFICYLTGEPIKIKKLKI